MSANSRCFRSSLQSGTGFCSICLFARGKHLVSGGTEARWNSFHTGHRRASFYRFRLSPDILPCWREWSPANQSDLRICGVTIFDSHDEALEGGFEAAEGQKLRSKRLSSSLFHLI